MCPPWLGCCVRLPSLGLLLSPNLSPILVGMLCPPPWSRLSLVSGLVSQLVSGLGCCVRVPGLVFSCLRSCLPTCLPSWLGCCVRPGLVFLLSPVLSPNLSPVWDAASASLVLACSCLRSCLPTCLPSWLGCCVPLSGLVFLLSPVLSPNLSPVWDAASVSLVSPSLVSGLVSQLVSHLGWDAVFASWSRLALVSGIVSQVVLFLSPNLSPILAGMLCLPPWSRLSLVSQLVSQLVSGLGCCVHLPGLVFSCLRSWLPTCVPSWLGCCVRLPGLVSQLVSGLGCCVRLPSLGLLLSPILSPNLSPILAGTLSQLVFHLDWDAVSASLVSSCSCLALVSGLVSNLSPILAGMRCPLR